MNSKCAKRILTSSNWLLLALRSSSWHQLLSSLILLSITIESKHFFSQQMENLTQTQKCLWLSHIVTFPKKLSKKVVQIKVSVFNSLKLVMILSAKSCIGEYWKKEILNKREYRGPVWLTDFWSADDVPFCSFIYLFSIFFYTWFGTYCIFKVRDLVMSSEVMGSIIFHKGIKKYQLISN